MAKMLIIYFKSNHNVILI